VHSKVVAYLNIRHRKLSKGSINRAVHSKVVAYLNIRHRKLSKGSINRAGTIATVTTALTRVVGVYLPGKAPIGDLRDDHHPRSGTGVLSETPPGG